MCGEEDCYLLLEEYGENYVREVCRNCGVLEYCILNLIKKFHELEKKEVK